MNKKVFISGIIVLIVVGYSVYIRQWRNSSVAVSLSGSQEVEFMKVPIADPVNGKLKTFSDVKPLTFTNTPDNTTISFRDTVTKARNSGSYLFVNGENVGQVQGAGMLYPAFSSDGKYFGFVSVGICGASCYNFYIYIVDIANRKLTPLSSPRTTKDYTGEKSMLGYEVNLSIGSLSWNDSDNLEILSYLVAFDSAAGAGYYRVSPKEVWEYNVNTQKYTFLKTLAE